MAVGNVFSKLQLIEEESGKIPGPKYRRGSRLTVLCPFHNDTHPSATVSLDTSESQVPIGFFGCFTCKKAMSWNSFAGHMGLRRFERPENPTHKDYYDPAAAKDELLGNTKKSSKKWSKLLKKLELHDEFPMEEWRGVRTALLDKVGASYCTYTEYNSDWIFLPVTIEGVMRGFVRARLQSENKKPSYLNAPGTWANEWGLIYYDYAVSLMKSSGLKTMVLCEGPRDSLRYLARGIPAVSVLGALNWNKNKRHLLEEAGVKRLILSLDGDYAGWKACRVIYKDVRRFFDVKYLSLWKTSPGWDAKKGRFKPPTVLKKMKKEGKLKGEMDPFNCPEKYIDLVENNLI